jgi:hypothetical protein
VIERTTGISHKQGLLNVRTPFSGHSFEKRCELSGFARHWVLVIVQAITTTDLRIQRRGESVPFFNPLS